MVYFPPENNQFSGLLKMANNPVSKITNFNNYKIDLKSMIQHGRCTLVDAYKEIQYVKILKSMVYRGFRSG